MSQYIALYRQWRPTTFKEVVEQQHITLTLKRAIKSDRISHAYLFSGTRGTGKTTLAKIFARAVNCLEPEDYEPCNKCAICKAALNESLLDIAEIDAASNNSVDNIRKICDEVNYMPVTAKYKVYIIDEVHMLSTSAFNALLKTLEEPPLHAIFILCTTEPNKLPATVLSRCQRFDFHRITTEGIAKRLSDIVKAEGFSATDEALDMIARVASGALRDAISLVDQCIASTPDTIETSDVLACAGLIDDNSNANIVNALAHGDVNSIVSGINDVIASGKSPSMFLSGFLAYLRNMLVSKNTDIAEKFIEADKNSLTRIKHLSTLFSHNTIIRYIKELSEKEAILKRSTQQKVYLEVMLIGLLEIEEPEPTKTDKSEPQVIHKVADEVKPVPEVKAVKPDSEIVNKVTEKAEPKPQVKPEVDAVHEEIEKKEEKKEEKEEKIEVKIEEFGKEKDWDSYIDKKVQSGDSWAADFVGLDFIIDKNRAIVTVTDAFQQMMLETDKSVLLECLKGYDENISDVKILLNKTEVEKTSLEHRLVEKAKELDIPVEIK